jgi:hypothetical protein
VNSLLKWRHFSRWCGTWVLASASHGGCSVLSESAPADTLLLRQTCPDCMFTQHSKCDSVLITAQYLLYGRRMASSRMLRRVSLVRIDVSEELGASIIRVTRIGSARRLLVTANVVPSSLILVTLWWIRYVPPKRRFLQDPHGVTPQKTLFFILTAVKT